jgi:hypothetical protein
VVLKGMDLEIKKNYQIKKGGFTTAFEIEFY